MEEINKYSNLLVENSAISNDTTKITDLNSDCMEYIFENLNFYDLLSVADSSKQFYGAVCQVFRRNYAKQNLIFNIHSIALRIR